ncbi:MAG: hypothetical protein KIS92_16340 [Planctomycetota bacterium]|nr:hypothetical protein [Planctomycetota bacterium]
MLMTRLLLALTLCVSFARAEDGLATSLTGDRLSINGGETKLGAAQWAAPEQSWRTVAELMKTALPPADANGKRAGLAFTVALDEKAPWGALKAVLMAAAASGIEKARVNVPGKPDAHVMLALPGADPAAGEVVDLPLTLSANGAVMTENGGQKVECTQALMKGLVKQLPKATVYVKPDLRMPAVRAVGILRALKDDAGASALAYLPVKQITAQEAAEREEAKSAVDRAFEGGLGGLGK